MQTVEKMALKAKTYGNKQNACLLWNPKKNAIIATAIDNTQSEDTSINHCIMVVLHECASVLKYSDDSYLGKHALEDDAYLCANTHLFVYEEPCSLS